MSLLSRHSTYVITDALTAGGQPVFSTEEATINEEGFDVLRQTYHYLAKKCTPEICAIFFPTGSPLAGRKWWVTGARPVNIGVGIWRIEVDYKGWAGPKPMKVVVNSAAEQQSAEAVAAPDGAGGGAVYAKVQTHQSVPEITVSYIVENVSMASKTSQVGTAQTPPVARQPPPNVWTTLPVFVYHWPNGWVLTHSAENVLPGTTVAVVTDTYKYIFDKTPG